MFQPKNKDIIKFSQGATFSPRKEPTKRKEWLEGSVFLNPRCTEKACHEQHCINLSPTTCSTHKWICLINHRNLQWHHRPPSFVLHPQAEKWNLHLPPSLKMNYWLPWWGRNPSNFHRRLKQFDRLITCEVISWKIIIWRK